MTVKPLRWQRSSYSLWARQLDIFWTSAQVLFHLAWERLLPPTSHADRIRRAQWVVGQILQLGPTFIKIGQALSTRADLLPLHYVETLSQLQDRVPPFDPQEAVALVEAELGQPLQKLYQDFDPTPLAAASLGQVHRARLISGEEVVVKVQRPGLENLFNLDLRALHRVVWFCDRFLPWTRQYKLEEIYHEFFTILYQEIDYVREGKNAERFRKNFAAEPRILVPKVYWRLTTKRILTIQYLPGIKVNDLEMLGSLGVDLKEINRLGICSYLKQLLIDGFFHADPHPGNMAVTPEGHLIFYDFGMMAEIKPMAKEKMIETFFAVLKKDSSTLIDNLVDLGLLERISDMTPIQRIANFILDKFTEKPLDVRAFGEMRSELMVMFEKQPFRMPAQMTFVVKSLTTLDGIARVLDPEYSLVAAAQPFVKSITVTEQGVIVKQIGKQARDFLKNRLQPRPNPVDLALRRMEERIEQGELQLRVRSLESERMLRQISLSLKSLLYICWTGFTLIAGAIFLTGNQPSLGIAFLVLSGGGCLVLIRSLIQLLLREKLDKIATK